MKINGADRRRTPIAAFVALGFEHSVANMFAIPFGELAAGRFPSLAGLLLNLLPVTVGNIIGAGPGHARLLAGVSAASRALRRS